MQTSASGRPASGPLRLDAAVDEGALRVVAATFSVAGRRHGIGDRGGAFVEPQGSAGRPFDHQKPPS
jgi:hypothetical protein